MIEILDKSLAGCRFIDLFAGLGGFRLALESLGARCVYSSEWDADAQRVYAMNFGETPDGDITKVDEKTIPDHDIICGGFPCQAFSISGLRRGFSDTRGTLFFDVARIIEAKRPRAVLLENVKNLASHDGGKTFQVIKGTLEELGYTVFHKVLNAVKYGVPQERERIYIVCFRNDLGAPEFHFPDPVPLERHVEDLLLDDESLVRDLYRDWSGRITWTGMPDDRHGDSTIRLGMVDKGGQGYRIYSVKGAGITLSAYGGGIFAKTGGYLTANGVRKLHPRECARMMGFPDSYMLSPKASHSYKQFGNSVVVDVLQRIAVGIGECLRKSDIGNIHRPLPPMEDSSDGADLF